jgi:hypothetical protein
LKLSRASFWGYRKELSPTKEKQLAESIQIKLIKRCLKRSPQKIVRCKEKNKPPNRPE